MSSQLQPILEQLERAWQHRRLAIIVAWSVFAALVAAICTIPSSYTSRAQLYVNDSSVLEPLLEGLAVPNNTDQQTDIVKRVLLARPTLDRVARTAGLYAKATSPEARDRVLTALAGNLKVEGSVASRAYTISYSNRRPTVARDVVAALLDTFIAGSARAGTEDTKEAADFFSQQVAEYADRLTAAEQKLSEFKKRNLGLMPDERGDSISRLQQEMAMLERLESDYMVAQRQQRELRSKISVDNPAVIGGPSVLPTADQIQQAQQIDAQIAQSRRELDGLLLKYTDRHPSVLAVQDTIRRLEQRRAVVAGNVRATGGSIGGDSLGSGPSVTTTLQISLNNADVQVAALQEQVAQARSRVGSLRRTMSIRPEVEAELAQLNRDYGVTKQRYEALLQRLESARISNRVDQSVRGKFQVLEGPQVAVRPSSPPRMAMTFGALVLALLAGGAASFLLAALHPVFRTRRAVEDALKLTVIGVVSRFRSPAEAAREAAAARRDSLTAGALVLVAVTLALTIEQLSTSIRALLESAQ